VIQGLSGIILLSVEGISEFEIGKYVLISLCFQYIGKYILITFYLQKISAALHWREQSAALCISFLAFV